MNDLMNASAVYPVPQKTEQLIKDWIAFADVKPTTEKNYRKAIKQFMVYLHENNIQNPTRQDIQNWKNWLIQNRSAGTAQLYLTSIKIWFKWLELEGIYPNITDHIKSPKAKSKGHKRKAMSPEQIKKLLAGIDRTTETGKRDFCMLLLMFSTCLRTVSISRADIKDLDGYEDWKKDSSKEVRLYHQGKGHDDTDEYVKLDQKVLEALNDYLGSRPDYTSDEPLFTGASRRIKGERLRTESISRIFKTRCRNVGIEDSRIVAHSARHSGATLAIKAGASLEQVQQLLGHESITTTMIYVHDITREENETEHKIIESIFKES